MGHIPYSHKRRPPTPLSSSPDGKTDEARRRRWEDFEREEDSGEDLTRMLLKLGRRLFVHQTHAIHRFNDYRGMLQRRLLVRAMGNDEERYEFLMERFERNRLRSREYLAKALALGVDQLTAMLEVQRGFLDEMLDRAERHQAAERKQAELMDRLLGLREDDVQQAAIKSMILFEKVRSLVTDSDPLLPKLDDATKRELLEYALGQREAPEMLDVLLRKGPRGAVRPGGGPAPREDELQRYELHLGVITVHCPPDPLQLPDDEAKWDRAPRLPSPTPFELTSNALDDKELAFFIGPCVSVAHPEHWAQVELPWPDARLQQAPLKLCPENRRDVSTEAGRGLQLQVLGKVLGQIHLEWTPWFVSHFQSVNRQLAERTERLSRTTGFKPSTQEEYEAEALHKAQLAAVGNPVLKRELYYRADIHIPAVNTVLGVTFQVVWSAQP